MKKVPFSVEWLSQSSQKPSHLGQGASEKAPTQGVLVGGHFSGSPDRLESEGPSTSFRPSELATATVGGPSATHKSSSRSEEAPPELAGAGSDPPGRGSRRLRTAFTTKQISTLESSFKLHHYLGAAERRKLAGKMQLSEVQIKTWFQNRRMKLKRQLQDLRPPDPPPGFPLQLYGPLFLRSVPAPPSGLPYSHPSSTQFGIPGLIQESLAGGLAFPPPSLLPLPPVSCKVAPPAALPSMLACQLNRYPEQASFLRTM
ncbi:homeobox protein VENTX [Macrotis lagotis]|uniref:homeobox protein VENTX n=1 Tax=Macrotis lagotis TaxID=92651 RepID=UPI003D686FDA